MPLNLQNRVQRFSAKVFHLALSSPTWVGPDDICSLPLFIHSCTFYTYYLKLIVLFPAYWLFINWSKPGGIKKIFYIIRLFFRLKKEFSWVLCLFIGLVWFGCLLGFQVEDFSTLQFGIYWRQNQTNKPRELTIVSFLKSWVSRQHIFSFYLSGSLWVCCVMWGIF